MLKTNFLSRINLGGLLVAIILIFGLFGPWLIVGYDSYAKINPGTKVGEAYYHSRVELNPMYASLYNDEVLIERTWFITFGTGFAGLILVLTAIFSIFKYKQTWAHIALLMLFIIGLATFFLSVGSGISIGVSTQIGWGLEVTGLALLISFIVALRELTRNSISRFVD
jgi:VIT1/CCC1 family predicted Fe2+/Mn2+ transporter